ncbi:MAG: UDP-N-acetylglucosamine 1-carboxyvinyltransferase [Chitinivibrionia bacterium]|nr:UDP-N-acetylglucosamine 1-carboxyvinyltransferase [Chitinivibrionia bacterium]
MSVFVVEGKRRLAGELTIAGNKNEALPLVAATILTGNKSVLENAPDIGDVREMCNIAQKLGADVDFSGKTLTIDSKNVANGKLPLDMARKIRGSILFAAPLLVRFGKVALPQPGGDKIGRRRLDTHFMAFEKLGAKVSLGNETLDCGEEIMVYYITAPKSGLVGTEIYLDEASVTATENAVMAAAGAHGETTIINAACEPHVQGVCNFLVKAGVKIEGIGSNILKIYGRPDFAEVSHTIGCDYIEAASFISLAACTNSDIILRNVQTDVMKMPLHQFARIGIDVIANKNESTLHIRDNQRFEVKTDMGNYIPRIETAPWPGFPADMSSVMLVAATQAKGSTLIHEKMFESRLFFTDNLQTMGAQIVLCDPHRAVIMGPASLSAARISSPDIRAGMALLIAAMSAEGMSRIHNIEQIDRGYEKIDVRLNAIGANIIREK